AEQRVRRLRLGDAATTSDHPAAHRLKAEYLDGRLRVEDDEVRRLSLLDPVLVLDAEGLRPAPGRAGEHLGDLVKAAHVCEMEREVRGVDEIGLAQLI